MKLTIQGLLIFFSGFLVGNSQTALPPVTDGLQVWLSATNPGNVPADGESVASWTDLHHGHVFRNANETLPTYVADSGDGKPAIDFTRSSGFIGDFSSTAGAIIGDATVFVVGRFSGYSHGASSSSYWFSIASATDGSEHTLGRDQRAGTGPDALYHWRGRPDQKAYYGDAIEEDPNGAFNYYTAIFRGAQSGGGVQASVNGKDGGLQNISGDPDTAYESDPSQTRIGLWTSNGSGLDGMIREVLIYDRILSANELADVEAYLADVAAVGEANAPGQLSITRRDQDVVVSWTGDGILQSATQLDGEWVNRATASNPLELRVTRDESYFRLIQTDTIPEGELVFRTQVRSDTHRVVEYHLSSGDLYFLGEVEHGFDWYSPNGNDLWWCFQNTEDRGSGLLEFLMVNNPQAQSMKARALAEGWTTYRSENYTFLLLNPLESQKTYVNQQRPENAGDNGTTRPGTDDYKRIDSSNLLHLLYYNGANRNIYLGIGGPSIRAATGTEDNPPGDGSSNLDNGVRADIAFKTNIQLSEELKQELVARFSRETPTLNDDSQAYPYDHPPGL